MGNYCVGCGDLWALFYSLIKNLQVFATRESINFAGLLTALIFLFSSTLYASGLADTIEKIKPSIVGVGTYQPTRAPRSNLMGTGFIVADGYHVVTNAHVVARKLAVEHNEKWVVFIGTGRQPKIREARIIARDEQHDLAILRLTGTRLPPLSLGTTKPVREGDEYAFTGFPIGAVLGLYPVTHRGIISSITPIVIPPGSSRQLNATMIQRLRKPYNIFQLDATAYPGNSGSPLYRPDTGEVVGVINKVFVKQSKEAILEKPSGISYAIPAEYLEVLLSQLKTVAIP